MTRKVIVVGPSGSEFENSIDNHLRMLKGLVEYFKIYLAQGVMTHGVWTQIDHLLSDVKHQFGFDGIVFFVKQGDESQVEAARRLAQKLECIYKIRDGEFSISIVLISTDGSHSQLETQTV